MRARCELDCLIHEKIMGWSPPNNCDGGTPADTMWHRDDRSLSHWSFEPPAYSTDIAAAFSIVDKLRESRSPIYLVTIRVSENFRCDITVFYDRGDATFYGKGSSVPEAICRAAMRIAECKDNCCLCHNALNNVSPGFSLMTDGHSEMYVCGSCRSAAELKRWRETARAR